MWLLSYLNSQQQLTRVDSSPVNVLPMFTKFPKKISISADTTIIANTLAKSFVQQLQKDARFSAGVDMLPSKEEYLNQYKQYYVHLHFRDKDVVIVNKTSLFSTENTNQTKKFVESGFLDLQNALQENFRTFNTNVYLFIFMQH